MDIASLWQEILTIWEDGGPLMWPLALLAMLIYYSVFQLFFYFDRSKLRLPESKIRSLMETDTVPAEGELATILDYTQKDVVSLDDVRQRFRIVRHAQLGRIDRRMRFLAILVSVAPLMGLLGTVTGMLATFRGLAGAGGGQTADLIAGGISEALITTETGLIIAIPGYVMLHLIRRRRNDLDFLLHRLESITMQRWQRSQLLAS